MKIQSLLRIMLSIMILSVFVCCDENALSPISCDPTEIQVGLNGGQSVVNIQSIESWTATTNVPWVTIDPSAGQGDAFVNIYVLPGNEAEANVIFSNGEGSVTLTITRKNTNSKDGALKGVFSVGKSAEVCFSQGNLQYQPLTNTWRFALSQYQIIGQNNANISAIYNGWIDLFGWGTGDNPLLISTNDTDYKTFTDWGVNKISNGGNKAGLWRSLTKDEMLYLFHGRSNAENLFAMGSVNGQNGIIVLPDNWTLPSGLTFVPSILKGSVWNEMNARYVNENSDNFSHNTYTASQWYKMEENGAVFVPAGGFRAGTNVALVGTNGYCWTSTEGSFTTEAPDEVRAYHLFVMSDRLAPINNWYRHNAYSVRLVKEQ